MHVEQEQLLGAALTAWMMEGDPSYLDSIQDGKKYLPPELSVWIKIVEDMRADGATTLQEVAALVKDNKLANKLLDIEEKSISWTKPFFERELEKVQRPIIAAEASCRLYDGAELEEVMDFMSEGLSSVHKKEAELKMMSLGELREHPKVQWLIEGLLPANSLACVYGPPGSGKSFLALDMAMKISCGGCFQDMTTTSGVSIYIAGEGISGLSDRVSSWLNYETIENGDLMVVGRPIDIAQDHGKIVHACRKSNKIPKLLVIDTLARCYGANDENSTADMQRFIIAIDLIRVQLGCTILVVHHSARNERRSMRGNSTLEGVMDTIIKVEAMERDDSKPQRIVVRTVKQKDGPAGEKYYYDITPHAESAVLRAVPTGVARAEIKGSPSGLLVALKDMIHSEDQWVAAAKWREAYPQMGPDFARTVADLVSKGYVRYRKVGASEQYRPNTPTQEVDNSRSKEKEPSGRS